MLASQLADVDAALLDSVVAEHWPETQTLEFKRQLPAAADSGRDEFLKDVCAFANAGGGDLVFGVQEKAACAGELIPIDADERPVDAVKRNLSHMLESGRVEPALIGVLFKDVPLASGGYALVVRVPPSFQRPHRYRVGDHWRWVVRSDTHAADLTYAQIRDAFDRSATLAERARRFRDERVSSVLSRTNGRPLRTGPVGVIHLIPLAAMTGTLSIDVRALYHDGFMPFMFSDWNGASRNFNLEGLVVHPGGKGDLAYTQVFRTGAFEAARVVSALLTDDGDKNIPSYVVSDLIRNALMKFLAATRVRGIAGPAIAGAALLDVHGYRLAHQGRYAQPIFTDADRQNILLPELWIDQLAAVEDPDAVIRPLLDTLWQAFDHPACPYYDAAGKFKPH